MAITIRPATTKDRVLQYGTLTCSLLKDIGNASNQPYLQAIASISLLIMETAQRVKENKEAVTRMTERAYELVCAVINICRDSEAELAPAMVRSIEQFSETLKTILTFVRSQVKGGFWRRVFRSMEDADLITECNIGLEHALDVFGVQSGIIAAVTMAEIQKDASKRHEEVIAILDKKKHPKRSCDSSSSRGSHSSSSRKKRQSSTQLSRSSTLSQIPASPKIFHGRDEELKHVVYTMLYAPGGTAARIAIVGPDGVGKTALTLAAAHDPQIRERFGENRFFVDCTAAGDEKQLISLMAAQLGLEEPARRKVIFKHFTATATAETPALVVLDAIGGAWKPFEHRNDVEDFLSRLADLDHVTIIVTLRGGERPRQVKWTRPFLPTLNPLPADAARATFRDISDVAPDDPGLDQLLALTKNMPGMITHIAALASFEGCSSLVARWEKEGPALLCETVDKGSEDAPLQIVPEAPLTEEPRDMHVDAAGIDTDTRDSPTSKTPVPVVEPPPPPPPPELSPETEKLLLSFLAPRARMLPLPSIASVLDWRCAAGVGVTT
ncbi:hypothetical protein C8J57DRAFT_344406 [Mycena rebaudengoi]|nr:hypothetical protein C8J57DRAFT_344406 [Mycena rebaudengoi]